MQLQERIQREPTYSSLSFLSDNMLQTHSIISQLGFWHRYSPLILFRFPQLYLYSCVCVFTSIQFYHMCRFVYLPHRKGIEQVNQLKAPVAFIITYISFLSQPTLYSILNPWWPPICPFPYNFISSRMLYEWNHTVCNHYNFFFSLNMILWKFIQTVVCMNSSFLFIAE